MRILQIIAALVVIGSIGIVKADAQIHGSPMDANQQCGRFAALQQHHNDLDSCMTAYSNATSIPLSDVGTMVGCAMSALFPVNILTWISCLSAAAMIIDNVGTSSQAWDTVKQCSQESWVTFNTNNKQEVDCVNDYLATHSPGDSCGATGPGGAK